MSHEDLSPDISFQTEKTSLLENSYPDDFDLLLSPTAMASDPIAAEAFSIEKRYLSAVVDKINSPSASGLQKTAEDSFDWLGDDNDLFENNRGLYTGPPVTLKSKTSLYDNIQPENPHVLRLNEDRQLENTDSAGENSDEDIGYEFLSEKVYVGAVIIVQMVLIAISILGVVGFNTGSLNGLPMHYWTILGSMTIFTPLISVWLIKILVKNMRKFAAFDNGELPNFIESLKVPIVLLATTLLDLCFWKEYFPRSCSPNEGPFYFCLFDVADKIFIGLFLTTIGFAAEISIMFFATLRFHERTFKTRIINCRFKIYVVQQLALKGLDAEIAKARLANGSNNENERNIYSANRTEFNQGSDSESGNNFLFVKKLYCSIQKYFSPHRIASDGRNLFGNASNFVQIQVEDQSPTVPVTASSQSYTKFSQKLKKHMKLYGYSQFAENKSGLKDSEARLLAKDLFYFLCQHGKDSLTFNDLNSCFASTQAAKDAYDIFDQDQDGIISKKEFRNTIVSIYSDLRDLTQSIKTAGTTLKKLDIILKLFFLGFLFLLLLVLFNVNISNMLTFTLSVVIGLNFIFGDLARHLLHSIVLLFINHPYDIGDTIVVGLFEEGVYLKDILTVRKINLMTTVFNRWNGQETYVPNHMLANAPFMTNLSRTVEQWEMLQFKLPSITQETVLIELRQKISKFLQENPKDFFKVFDLHAVVAADMGESEKNLNDLEFSLRVKCRSTSDSQKRWARHAKLLSFIKISVEKSSLNEK